MIIAIENTAHVAAFTTETPNLVIKSESAYLRICDRGKFKKVVVPYSYEQNLNTLTHIILHN